MKYLRFCLAILRIKFYHTRVIIKKKLYFCGAKKGDDPKNPDRLFNPCSDRVGRFAVRVSALDIIGQAGILVYAQYGLCGVVRFKYIAGTFEHIFIPKKTTPVCDEQAEYDIEPYFIRIICVPFTKPVRRNHYGFREGHWDVSPDCFYRFVGIGQQSHQEG
jgi:hypothetical protein